ncbi:hypothetical protein VNI00_012619 [Paramarasmius palmivorus]|uniref:Uncharacterized protein n=1 Tax=Paramarasmius palmivorus TaxID=297713 RepID=A0AAW0C3S0_9AGAR
MSDTPENIGTTLAGGIQDVSALLPLLGTEQVERHVGSALEKGYLYAAASNLSLFGSLGSAKAAFATCVGTITHRRFYGGQWLDDAGFGTAGSVTSMVTIDKDTGWYGAEVKLRKLLLEQHIDDPNLVSGFEWSGWRRNDGGYDAVEAIRQLNSRGYADGGRTFSEYGHYIVSEFKQRDFNELGEELKGACKRLGLQIAHLFKLGLELALQLRIHCITNTSLEWMKAKHKKDNHEGTYTQKVQPLEQRIHDYLHKLEPPSSIEQGRENVPNDKLKALLAVSPMLVIYQLLIAAGMVMIVVGYVGCFSIVKNSNAPAGPYVWFGMEAFLSLLRMVLWGLNPSWDESTGLTMNLELHDSKDSYYPLITTPYKSTELGFVEKLSSPKPFTVFSEAEFFAAATLWVGPIQQFGVNAITLYYALLPCQVSSASETGSHTQNTLHKSLSVTVSLTDSRTFTFLCHGHKANPDSVFSSTLETHLGIGSISTHYQVVIGDKVDTNDGFLRSQLFRDIVQHSYNFQARMFTNSQSSMQLKWNFLGSQKSNLSESENHLPANGAPLSEHDKRYLKLGPIWDSSAAYLQARQLLEIASKSETLDGTAAPDQLDIKLYTEVLSIFESAMVEVYIWGREHEFIEQQTQHWEEKIQLQLHTELYGAMVVRMATQKKHALLRYQKYPKDSAIPSKLAELDPVQLEKAWAHLLNILQKLYAATSTSNELQQMVQQHYKNIRYLQFERIDSMIELGSHLLPATIHNILISNTACLNSKALREECVYQLCLALQYMPNAPPPDTVPYVAINNALAVPYIQKKVNLHALEISLYGMNKKPFGEYLSSITYPDQNTTHTTTLILQSFDSDSSDLKSAFTDHITKHPNILCLAGTRCHRLGEACEELYCKAILTNQELWRKSVEKRSGFAYQVGFEAHDNRDVQAKGDYIQLLKRGRALVLFYAPSAGEVTVMLSVHNIHDVLIKLKATLKSDMDGRPVSKTQEVSAGNKERKDDQENVVFVFSVQKGVGEITIQGPAWPSWEIHGLVKVQWKSRNEAEQRVEGGLEDRGGE